LNGADGIRLDKWLWQARFFKTRSLASKVCAAGKVRVDGEIVRKAHYVVRVGHVLTFPKARDIHVVRIEALGARRGPATEAQTLYSVFEAPP
jgi:ribosome-associated heat shock protein Hsp15